MQAYYVPGNCCCMCVLQFGVAMMVPAELLYTAGAVSVQFVWDACGCKLACVSEGNRASWVGQLGWLAHT